RTCCGVWNQKHKKVIKEIKCIFLFLKPGPRNKCGVTVWLKACGTTGIAWVSLASILICRKAFNNTNSIRFAKIHSSVKNSPNPK
ncbi:MAG: hypothetical protein ABI370_00500, partial [Gammaproteobacteria bacterium]